MKTTKSAASRFKITGSGKILRRKIGQRHLHITKRRTNLRRGKKPIVVTGAMERKIKKLLGV